MFNLTVFTSLVALLYTALGTVDARTIVARAAEADDAIKRSTIVQRDVVSPPITYPTTGTVWVIGSRHNVTWDTSVIPPGFKSNGMIVLGFLDDADGVNEHLDLDHPLAKNFPITTGRAEITVPAVSTRNSYILVLFGDSGNASGKFTIKNISIGSPPSSTGTGSSSTATAKGTSSASSASSDDSSNDSSTGDAKPSSTGSGAATASSPSTESGAAPTSTAPASQSAAVGSSAQGSAVAESASAPSASAPSSGAAMAVCRPSALISVTCLLGIALGLAL